MHIAVIIPAYNIAPFLGVAVRSVLAQTHTRWSLAVVDDGSTDQTAAIAASFIQPRVRLIRQSNAGVSAARNRGVTDYLDPRFRPLSRRETQSGRPGYQPANPVAGSAPLGALTQPDAFLFLDGDDWLDPCALAVLAAALDAAPSAVAACAPYARVGLDSSTWVSPIPPGGDLLKPLLTRNLFANGGHVLIRRDALQAAGEFRRDLSYGEDWEFWIRLALLGEFAAVKSPKPSLYVRERPGSAYFCRAADPASYRPVIEAVHRNSAIVRRLGPVLLARLRQRADAETAWTIGRELIRHGHNQAGRRWLVRSVRRFPSLKRVALLGLSWLRTGPFRPYQLVA